MKLSSIANFLPFNPTPAKNSSQRISRIALATGGGALVSWGATSNPVLTCALSAIASLWSEAVRENRLVNDFLKSECPSTNLMLRIVDSPGTIELLIGKIKNQKNPEILTKKSESGKTLLQHFVERRKLIEDVSDSEWDDFIHHASFFCKTESGKAELLQDVEKRKLQRNTDTSEPSVFSNQQRLKRLLFSGPWDKDSFFTCLGLIHEKTLVPDYWFKGTLDPYLLSNWQAHLHLALLKRDDFSESEKMKAFEYTTILK